MSPVDPVKAWTGDFYTRIRARVRARGFASIGAFLRAHTGEGYTPLSESLGDDVAPVQLAKAHLREAYEQGVLRDAALDGLTRKLREYLGAGGWGSDDHSLTRMITASSFWAGDVAAAGGADLDQRTAAVWKALCAAKPPQGWTPEPEGDPLLHSAFDQGWPVKE